MARAVCACAWRAAADSKHDGRVENECTRKQRPEEPATWQGVETEVRVNEA